MGTTPDDPVDRITAVRAKQHVPVAPGDRFELLVRSGPDQGKRVDIDLSRPSRVLIGQSPACDFRLTDPQVSRRHAAVELAGHHLRLADLGSSNGTLVNGITVFEALLIGGETIRLGDDLVEVRRLAAAPVTLSTASRFGRVVGASPEMRRLYPLCERLAASQIPVIIEGETGTGKEALAESIHELSSRAAGPFVIFDCTSVPANLLESALFGHERGAFTGATETRVGVFEEAHGGTLLIDEIGDLDIALQAKLLRALERLEVRRVGGNRAIKVDARIIAATRRDLDREVQAGRFRDDLFFRIAVGRIELPPLRRRVGDVALLAQHFWTQLGGTGAAPSDLLRRCEHHDWPGNVRELHNAVARHLALGDEDAQPVDSALPPLPHATDAIERVLALNLPLPRAREHVVSEFERRYVERVLEQHGGNVAKAASASGIARRYFQLLRARRTRAGASGS